MPVIGSCDRDGVNFLVLEQLANVGIGLRPGPAELLNVRETFVRDVLVDIAQSCKLYTRDLVKTSDVVLATAARSNSHTHAIIRAQDSPAQCKRGCSQP